MSVQVPFKIAITIFVVLSCELARKPAPSPLANVHMQSLVFPLFGVDASAVIRSVSLEPAPFALRESLERRGVCVCVN